MIKSSCDTYTLPLTTRESYPTITYLCIKSFRQAPYKITELCCGFADITGAR